ncbi:hypothetical protein AX16_005037, partial [Volvariella volvacea WC 439]
WTLFWGSLDQKTWGKGRGKSPLVEDNIEQFDHWVIRDKTNYRNKCGMYADVPRIIRDILKNGAQIAIVSQNTSKAMCDRALRYWKVDDEKQKSIIDVLRYNEVYDQPKTVHFSKIKESSGFDYSDMILFDDDAANNLVEMMLGVTFQVSRDEKGLTWDNYQQGIEMWRRNQRIRSPYLGNDLNLYPKRRLIGYAGMDEQTVQLLESGGRRQDRKEAARWGYAMYITDNPAIARYFAGWIKRNAFGFRAKTHVCSLWVRDGDLFDSVAKIWVPDRGNLWTNNQHWNATQIAWSQENRDDQVAKWGVQKPYILFSRHPYMFGMPIRRGRWNEMVVYGQVQEALFLTIRMSNQEVADAIRANNSPRFDQMISAWNITVPQETWRDFGDHRENFAKL